VEGSPVLGGIVWIVIIVLCGLVYWRMKTRRRHIGSAAAGTVYDMINDEKRNAIEILVEDKAAARDFERAGDDSDENVRGHGGTETQR
jgi:hypothetical protein